MRTYEPNPSGVCTVEGCDLATRRHRMCNKHATRFDRYGDVGRGRVPYHSEVERFWPKVEKTAACWLWVGAIGSGGYGNFYTEASGSSGSRKYRTVPAHRWSYEHLVGPVPEGLHLDHLCRNRACVNPVHLEPVTATENLRRGTGPSAVNGAATHCPLGHPYSEANTYRVPTTGWRQCRICRRETDRRRHS